MIVVCPIDPQEDSMWVDSFDGRYMRSTALLEELIPHIDTTYRTVPEQRGRVLQGFSMGGFGALVNGLRAPDHFSSNRGLGWCAAQLGNDVPKSDGDCQQRCLLQKPTLIHGHLGLWSSRHPARICQFLWSWVRCRPPETSVRASRRIWMQSVARSPISTRPAHTARPACWMNMARRRLSSWQRDLAKIIE